MKKLKSITLFVITALAFVSILIHSQASTSGVTQGLLFSANILIPSLFPFMFLASFAVQSGLSAKLNSPLNKITKSLFNLPGCTAATIFISFIGGYPTGARGIATLYERKEINEQQAAQMLCFTIGGGPAFIISVVGGTFLGNTKTGLILFAAHVISSIFIGIAVGWYTKLKQVPISNNVNKNSTADISKALVQSCTDTTYAIINTCAFVILFSSLLSILNASLLQNFITQLFILLKAPLYVAQSIIPIIFEVTSGCSLSTQYSIPAEILAFALGWAGICIHFQIFSTLSNIRFSKIKFIIFRLMHGILSAILTHVGFMCFPEVLTCNISIQSINNVALFSSNVLSSIALFILSVAFLFFVHKNPRT